MGTSPAAPVTRNMEFRKLKRNDIEIARPYLGRAGFRTCDLTVGGLFLWRSVWQTEYAIEDDTLYTRLWDVDGSLYYNLPLGGDRPAAIARLREREGHPLRFCTIPAGALTLFPEPVCVTPHRELADYLYRAEDLINLTGKKYAGQRNHAHAFARAYGDGELEPITPANLAEVTAFFEAYCPPRDSATAKTEHAVTADLLRDPTPYGMAGYALRAGGRIVGFSFGEVVGDTLFVHIEKADRATRGAHQVLMRRFAATMCGPGVTYINREDDAGDEGLRTAKLALHPCTLVEKYTVML